MRAAVDSWPYTDVAEDLTPGVSVGTTNIDIRWCVGASGSVTAITIRNDAKRACEENHFSPLITHSSPSQLGAAR